MALTWYEDFLMLDPSSPPKAAQRRSSDSSRSTARTPQSRMPPGTAAAKPARPACGGIEKRINGTSSHHRVRS